MNKLSYFQILELSEEFTEKWDKFVLSNKRGSTVFLSGMRKVYEKIYGFTTNYFIAVDNNENIHCVLPSVNRKRGYLVSLPFTHYGGFLFKEGLKDKEHEILFHAFKKHFISKNIHRLHVVGGVRLPFEVFNQSNEDLFFPVAYLNLIDISSERDVFKKIDYSIRKAIKKAQRNNLTCRSEMNADVIKEKFYPLYLKSMKKFGTPPHAESYFLSMYKYLGSFLKLFIIEYKGMDIACLLGSVLNNKIELMFTCSDKRYLAFRPNDFAHWAFIKWAALNGIEFVDFGPMKYKGQSQYKKKWGVTTERRYSYEICFINGKAANIKLKKSLANDAFLVKTFSSLLSNIPLKFLKLTGPLIRRVLKH